jgi:hypothetical protein
MPQLDTEVSNSGYYKINHSQNFILIKIIIDFLLIEVNKKRGEQRDLKIPKIWFNT